MKLGDWVHCTCYIRNAGNHYKVIPSMEADIIACAARSVVRDEIFDKEVTRVTAGSGQLKVYFASDKEVQP